MADAHTNFALSTVLTPPAPATSGTSLVVASGTGARFPAAPFNITVWPANALATAANAEIARVTARTGDSLTITRAQEGSTARAIVVDDQVMAGITARTLQDVESELVPATIAWTPVDGSGAGLALTGNGRYATIGKLVIFQFAVTWPGTASGATAQVGGLPYTSAAQGAGVLGYSEEPTVERIFIQISSSSFYPVVNVTNAVMSGKTIIGAGFYFRG